MWKISTIYILQRYSIYTKTRHRAGHMFFEKPKNCYYFTCLEVLALSRDLLTKLTIVNAKDSLCNKLQNFRPIVEFPGEGLGYRLTRRRRPGRGESNFRIEIFEKNGYGQKGELGALILHARPP
jgi:hypothetical protein